MMSVSVSGAEQSTESGVGDGTSMLTEAWNTLTELAKWDSGR
jgi:hypothetical protein